MKSFQLLHLYGVAILSTIGAVAAQCGGSQPLHLCCRTVAPWSSNSGVWGNICGVFPTDPNTLMGGACEEVTSTCPQGPIEVCCSSGSTCGDGVLGNNCSAV
ncbi:hypothetical protein K474DRAFT_956995 [Panus rudis PR-1116 ss-1]|nr:hypothetical protein K474DRAFT_956995 [Panus rudis PR-1116 ss-1]